MKRKSPARDQKESKTEIVFNRNFYDKEAIMKSLEDFKGVLSGSIIEDEKAIRVVLNDVKGDAEKTKNEFCNYVFALMKNRGIV